jgi:invasin D
MLTPISYSFSQASAPALDSLGIESAVTEQVPEHALQPDIFRGGARRGTSIMRFTAALDRELADPVKIDATAAASVSVAEYGDDMKKRLEKNRDVAAALQKQSDRLETELKPMNRLIMQEMMRFHEFEYGLGKPQIRSGDDKANPTGTGDFFDKLKELIGLIGSDYLAVYERLIEQYSAMFKEFNEKIMAKMGDWVQGVNDGKEVMVNVRALGQALDELIAKYGSIPDSVLYPLENEDGTTTPVTVEEAKKWAAAMGLPESCVVVTGAGYAYVKMDISPLIAMKNNLPPANHPTISGFALLDSAKFQAWQTGFNSQEAEMKNFLQIATGKYSNAQGYNDNFIKILSSQLSQFAEMLKGYLS